MNKYRYIYFILRIKIGHDEYEKMTLIKEEFYNLKDKVNKGVYDFLFIRWFINAFTTENNIELEK